MRDDRDGAVELADEALEQAPVRGVEVRLGLVQEKHVRLLREARGEGDQLPLAA